VRIDLHCHSDVSDGTEPPAEVVRWAATAGVDLIALTDHDTTAGVAAAATAGASVGVQVVLGCEVSCLRDGVSVHLLGYLFDPAHAALADELELIRTDRVRRAAAMVERLRELGADVEYARVLEIAGDAVSVGRPHVARALVERGVVADVPAAFTDQWIGNHGRAYVEKRALDPVDAVRRVREAGGVAVCAHPGATKRGAIDDELLAEMTDSGLSALEVDHPDHDEPTRTRLRSLAGRLGLLTTGSSDDHGALTGHRLGVCTTDPDVWEALAASARIPDPGVSSEPSARP
jgi:predicted metal-dependent phosphoesterase TrpH